MDLRPPAQTPTYYRARIDFEFGGVSMRAGQAVPVHRTPWKVLLNYGLRYVEPVYEEVAE